SSVNCVGDINFIGCGIDRHRTKAYELSIATSLTAPTRKDLTIGTELHDSVATRIDNINRIIRANSNPAWSIKARLRAFPLGDEFAVGSQLLHSVLGAYLRDVNIARAINCDSTGRFKLSYARNESARWREFFDACVVGIGDQIISFVVN